MGGDGAPTSRVRGGAGTTLVSYDLIYLQDFFGCILSNPPNRPQRGEGEAVAGEGANVHLQPSALNQVT